MTERYETWDDVPTGVMVHNGGWRLIKCSSFEAEPIIVGTVIRAGTSGWIHRASGVVDGCGPFFRCDGAGNMDTVAASAPAPTNPVVPREWADFADVPDGVKVLDRVDDMWRKLNGRWWFKISDHGKWTRAHGSVSDITQTWGPFTEIVPQPPAEPRQWRLLEEVPDGVKVRSRAGNKWRRRHGQWQIKTDAGTRWRNNNPMYSIGPFTEIVK